MRKSADKAITITEARLKSNVSVVLTVGQSTQSNSRTIPYAELYRGRTSMMETPAENLQRAAEAEELRRSPR